MLKYGVFVFLFLTAVTLFFVGLFANILPLVLVGAILLAALFVTRHAFMPIQQPKPDS
jgi:4-hydroxybenzoate polyprenyltransferase